MSRAASGPLLVSFDASLRYADDNATPSSAAVGYVVADGTEPIVERSMPIEAFVSSSALELRALVEAARAVADIAPTTASVHVRGDADAAVNVADPTHPATPTDDVARRRVETIRSCLAEIPVVTYRVVPRGENARAHALAQAGHTRSTPERD
jgi:ribonuclease HI